MASGVPPNTSVGQFMKAKVPNEVFRGTLEDTSPYSFTCEQTLTITPYLYYTS